MTNLEKYNYGLGRSSFAWCPERGEGLEKEVSKLAEIIASKSNKVLKIGKEAFYKQIEMPLDKAYKYTSKVMCENMMTLDAREGISAFLEKRKPNWKNK